METFAGIVGGATGVLLSHPFDTLRVRIQSLEQKPPIFEYARNLVSTQGVGVLYRGIVPPLIGMGIEKGTVFSAYSFAKSKVDNNFIAGYFAGLMSSLIITPIEKVKIQMQTSKSSLLAAITETVKNRAVYQGFTPTFFREAIGFGIYFTTYRWYNPDTPLHFFIGGALSGSFAWLFIYPIDTIKTNAQVKKINILQFMRTHSLRDLYRGFPLAIMRAGPLHGGVFLGYELSKRSLQNIIYY